MSDEHISETQNAPRCPVCATGFTATPGAACPACRLVLAVPRPMPVRVSRWRSPDEGFSVLVTYLVTGAVLLAIMPFVLILTTFAAGLPGLAAGGVVFVVFVLVFLYYWPRAGSGSPSRSSDPEN